MDMTITLIITLLILACFGYRFITLVFRVLMNMFKFLSDICDVLEHWYQVATKV